MRNIFFLFWAAISAAAAGAAPPQIIHHQGRIVANGINFGSPTARTGYFKFALVNGDGAQTFWTNDGTNTGAPGGAPTASVSIQVDQGFYAVELGNVALANMTAMSPAIFTLNDDVRLRIWFSSDDVAFDQLSPDRRILTTGYAFSAQQAETVADGSITTAKLADEIRPKIESSAGEPEPANPTNTGTLYYDTTTGNLTVSDGAQWAPVRGDPYSPVVLWKGHANSDNNEVDTWERPSLTQTLSPSNGQIAYDAASRQFTFNTSGYYEVRFVALRDNPGGAVQMMRLVKNTSTLRATRESVSAEYQTRIDEAFPFQAGDTMHVELIQSGQGTNWLEFDTTERSGTCMQIRYLGPL